MLEKQLGDSFPSWYGMIVRMGRESEVKEQIINNKIKVDDMIIPEPNEFINEVVVGDKLEERHRYFLGYIFVKTNLDVHAYHNLLSLSSVYRFLGSLKEQDKMKVYIPSRIPEDQIQIVKDYLDGCDDQQNEQLKIGDKVEIKSGDLASIKGLVIAVTEKYVTISPPELSGQVVKVPLEKIAVCQ